MCPPAAKRTCVVTGAASGIGAAVASVLREAGHRVISVDLRNADAEVDLASVDGRARMVEIVDELSDGIVDAVVANAGVIGRGATAVRVNYFGAVATLEGLRPLLARGAAPRAVATASVALTGSVEPRLVDACLAGAEADAATLVDAEGLDAVTVYASTKRALARWIRAHAPLAEWGGAGIAVNAVAPGIVRTPMTEPILADPAGADLLAAATPMPFGGIATPEALARLVAFLAGPDCEVVTGQVIFADGGADCVMRGDDIWA